MRVDILVNNAATNPQFGSILDSEPWQWQKIIDVNMMGYFLDKQVRGRINGSQWWWQRSSIWRRWRGINPGLFMGIYSISKAAVIMMTKVLAQELGGRNIQVNALAPGIIKTRFAEALWTNDEISKQYTDRTPAGRIGEPEENCWRSTLFGIGRNELSKWGCADLGWWQPHDGILAIWWQQ